MSYINRLLYRIKRADLSHSVIRNRMAGRVQNWLRDPNRPSLRSDTLILHFAVDVKRLVLEGKQYPWLSPQRCPSCAGLRLWGHGYVLRYFEGLTYGLWMKRFRCPDCRAVHTCRPVGFYRGFSYSIDTILLSLLEKIHHGRWLRCLSRQSQQYWWRGFRVQASRLRNVINPGLFCLGALIRAGYIPSTHCVQRKILRC
jgi:hypothetical protein